VGELDGRGEAQARGTATDQGSLASEVEVHARAYAGWAGGQ
jgi:hypothetical protein